MGSESAEYSSHLQTHSIKIALSKLDQYKSGMCLMHGTKYKDKLHILKQPCTLS